MDFKARIKASAIFSLIITIVMILAESATLWMMACKLAPYAEIQPASRVKIFGMLFNQLKLELALYIFIGIIVMSVMAQVSINIQIWRRAQNNRKIK